MNTPVLFDLKSTGKWVVDFSESGLLLKVGKRTHLESLQAGKLYMKPLGFHVENEKKYPGLGTGDAEEGILTKISNAEVLVDGKVAGKAVDAELHMCRNNPVFCCMTADFQPECGNILAFRPDKRMLTDFAEGDSSEYGVIMIDRTAFLNRIRQRCEEVKITWLARSVIYTDDFTARMKEENGILVPPCFFKRIQYEYQHEFRIVFSPVVQDFYELDIGDISDISRLFALNIIEYGIEIHCADKENK